LTLIAFVIFHLRQFPVRDQSCDLLRRQVQKRSGQPAEFIQLVVVDVAPLVLAKAVQKHRPIAAPKRDHRAIAAALVLPRTRQALLDQAATQVSIDQSRIDVADRLAASRR
jgi:hypothetical protein